MWGSWHRTTYLWKGLWAGLWWRVQMRVHRKYVISIHQRNYAIIPSASLLSFRSWVLLSQWILSGILLPCWDCRRLLLQSSPREVLQKFQRRLYTMVRVSGFQYALVIFAITTQPCGTWKVLQLNQACKWMNNVACIKKKPCDVMHVISWFINFCNKCISYGWYAMNYNFMYI